MTVDQLADLYVDIIEPGIKLGLFFVLLIIVLHSINMLRDGGASGGFVGVAFKNIIKFAGSALHFLGVALRYVGNGVLYLAHVIMSTLRDFLTSKI